MKKTLLLLAVLTGGAYAVPSTAASNVDATLMLVRITALHAIGPDGQPYTLYHNDPGMLTPEQDLGRVAYAVQAGNLPEGAYHTLHVHLADEATVIYADGSQKPRSLGKPTKPTERRISGMLWVDAGNVSPMRIGRQRTTPYPAYHGDDD